VPKLGYCLIGCGRIAESRLGAIASLKNVIDLVAIVSRNRSEAEGAAKNVAQGKRILFLRKPF